MRKVVALTHFPPGLLPLIASFVGTDSIMVVGGYSHNSTPLASAVCYSLATHSWRTDVPPMSIGRWLPTAVTIGGRMMVFGGLISSITADVPQVLAACESFDLVANRWTMLPPMSTPRAAACAVTWHGRAFVFGGYRDSTVLSSAECFDPNLNRWSVIAPMHSPRFSASAVALPGRGGLLVIGGIDDQRRQLQSAELYDPTSNQWTAMAWQLPKPLWEFAAQCIGGVLHVVGGTTPKGLLGGFAVRPRRTTECWSMDLNHSVPAWLSLPPLPLSIWVHPADEFASSVIV